MNSDWSKSKSVIGKNIVATSQPLAVQAGIDILKAGGNAVDAAIASAICLTVVEPTGNGIGSDAFAIVWDGNRLHGLNGSGRSPKAWTFDRFAQNDKMPVLGWDSVTVPGAVSTWAALSEKFGKLNFERLFEPALKHAREGYPVTPIIAAAWKRAESRFNRFPNFRAHFLPNGKAPKAGEKFTSTEMVGSLEEIALTKGESFYRGAIAKKIVASSQADNGLMTLEDLDSHSVGWVEPISIDYKGITLHELPPNGQGLAALVTLGILNHFDLAALVPDSADSIHLQVEAMKLGLADIARHLADPESMTESVESLLEPDRLKELAKTIDSKRANHPTEQPLSEKGTVYLSTADQSGMMVSFIQSNYMGFGSGVVIPGTGISMQNRGAGFSLLKGHPNRVDGNKRPYHTIIPGFVTRDGMPLMSYGMMGGHIQAQGQVQMINRIFDHSFDPQKASDSPRWCLTETYDLAVEPGYEQSVLDELAARGHRLKTALSQSSFGGAQLIYKDGHTYYAGSDRRKDGNALAF